MARGKYRVETPEQYRAGNEVRVKGGGSGPKTAAAKMALLKPQAQFIIDKFGGARELARVLKEFSDNPEHHFAPSTIYRWMYPKDVGGQGGEIPARHIKLIIRAARFAGILLTDKDIYPHLFPGQLE